MKELASIEGNLKPLFEKNAPQIWLGDYNRWYNPICRVQSVMLHRLYATSPY